MKFLEVKTPEGESNLISIDSITKVSQDTGTMHTYEEIRAAIRDHMLSSRIIIRVAPKSEVWDGN